MSRYIDVSEDAIKSIFKKLNHRNVYPKSSDEMILRNYLDEFPTADVVEVIPCKDCFYAKPYNAVWHLPVEENNLWCSRYEEEKEKDWFCADAIERTVKK